jgi:hypothetical protein
MFSMLDFSASCANAEVNASRFTGAVGLTCELIESFNDWSTGDRVVQRSFKSGWVELLEGAVEQCIDIALGVWLSLYPGKHEKTLQRLIGYLRWRKKDCDCADHS